MKVEIKEFIDWIIAGLIFVLLLSAIAYVFHHLFTRILRPINIVGEIFIYSISLCFGLESLVNIIKITDFFASFKNKTNDNENNTQK